MKLTLISFLLSLSIVSFGIENDLSRAKAEYENLLNRKSVLLPHKGTYLMPASYNFNATDSNYPDAITGDDRGEFVKELETEFQISFLVLTGRKVFNSNFDIFLGYTQHSWWQLYNDDWSSPFRETNYEPELFARKIMHQADNLFGVKLIGYDFGLVHQSNGQIQELTRSWNRVFTRAIFNYGKLFVKPTLWWRVPESTEKDQNPDIKRYIGFSEVIMNYYHNNNTFGLKWIPGTRYHGLELNYSYPIEKGLRLYVKGFYGYGESLINYDQKAQRVAVGFSVSDIVSEMIQK